MAASLYKNRINDINALYSISESRFTENPELVNHEMRETGFQCEKASSV